MVMSVLLFFPVSWPAVPALSFPFHWPAVPGILVQQCSLCLNPRPFCTTFPFHWWQLFPFHCRTFTTPVHCWCSLPPLGRLIPHNWNILGIPWRTNRQH